MKNWIRHLSCVVAAVVAVVCFSSGAAKEPEPRQGSEEVVGALRETFRAFNAGEKVHFRAAWAEHNVYIVDDLPPYIWSGEGAWDKWMSDAAVASTGLTHLSIRALPPLRVDVGEKFAYVLLPVEVTYEDHGKSMRQRGTQINVMVRTPQGWKIQGMSYAGQTPTPSQAALGQRHAYQAIDRLSTISIAEKNR